MLLLYFVDYSPSLPPDELDPSFERFSGGLSRSLATTPSTIASRVRLPNCMGSLSSSSDMIRADKERAAWDLLAGRAPRGKPSLGRAHAL